MFKGKLILVIHPTIVTLDLMSSWMETKETRTGQRITVLPCSFSYEALKRALSTSQKVLSGEPDDLVPAEVLSGNSTTRTQVVPIPTVTVPNKSCHSGLRWLAREKRRFLFPVLLLCHWPLSITSLNNLCGLSWSSSCRPLQPHIH